MYERFTDRARKVIQLANQEAQRFNHEYIGTEHILLGLIKESSGVAATILKNLGLDLRNVRLEVEKIVQSGPCMVIIGRLPQTPRLKRVIEYAIEEARILNHTYVGTEHLLLGLFREPEGVAHQILWNLGVKFVGVENLRDEVLKYLGQERPKGTLPKPLATRVPSLPAETKHIRSLEQQLWSVRVVLGIFTGAMLGAVVGGTTGAVWSLILGGLMPVLGGRLPATLTGILTGILLAATPLRGHEGGLPGIVMVLAVSVLIAMSFTSPKRYAQSILASALLAAWVHGVPPPPYPPAGLCLSGGSLGFLVGVLVDWIAEIALEKMQSRRYPWRESLLFHLSQSRFAQVLCRRRS